MFYNSCRDTVHSCPYVFPVGLRGCRQRVQQTTKFPDRHQVYGQFEIEEQVNNALIDSQSLLAGNLFCVMNTVTDELLNRGATNFSESLEM